MLTFQKSILAGEYSEEEIRKSIEAFVCVIPDIWKDAKFKEEWKAAKITESKDVRPLVVANVRMNEETCEKLGLPITKDTEVFDYYKLFQACINLLERKNLLTKIFRIEELEGLDLDNLDEATLLESNLSNQ